MQNPNQSEIVKLWGTEIVRIMPHLWLRYIWDELGRWNLCLTVDEETTRDDLHNNWARIADAREQLKRYQGSNESVFKIALMEELKKQRRLKVSYGDLAKDLNFDALLYLYAAAENKMGETYTQMQMFYFYNLLSSLSIKSKDFQKWEDQGRNTLSQIEKLSWLATGPITGQRVAKSLRKYEEKLEYKEVIIKTDIDETYFLRIWSLQMAGGYWSKAKELLQKSDPENYMKYDKRLQQREGELLTSIPFPGRKIT